MVCCATRPNRPPDACPVPAMWPVCDPIRRLAARPDPDCLPWPTGPARPMRFVAPQRPYIERGSNGDDGRAMGPEGDSRSDNQWCTSRSSEGIRRSSGATTASCSGGGSNRRRTEAVSEPGNYGFVDGSETGGGINGGVGGGEGYERRVLLYVGVPDVEAALKKAESLGGGAGSAPRGLPDASWSGTSPIPRGI